MTSCTNERVVSELTKHSWAVEEVKYEDSIYGLFFFHNNTMSFQKDGKCELPDFKFSAHLNSSYKIKSVRDESFKIAFYNSDEEFLDGVFRGKFIFDSIGYRILILENSRLKLLCKSEK